MRRNDLTASHGRRVGDVGGLLEEEQRIGGQSKVRWSSGAFRPEIADRSPADGRLPSTLV